VAEIGDFPAGVGDVIGDAVAGTGHLGLIPLLGRTRTTRRTFRWLRNGEGWSGVAAPWRGGGGALASFPHREHGKTWG
jgi:hypothetical protein